MVAQAAIDLAAAQYRVRTQDELNDALAGINSQGGTACVAAHLDCIPGDDPQSPAGQRNEIIAGDAVDCGGRPCIRGLHIRVKDILDMLAGGATRQEILADYPYLEDEDITAALEYASRATDHPVIAAAE